MFGKELSANMPDFSVYTLASSSKGNCTYIKYGNDEILIDAGISTKRIENSLKQLGTELGNISAIFITHEHTDHISGLVTLSKKYDIPIHITELSAKAMLNTEKYAFVAGDAKIHPPMYSVNVGDIGITSFVTPHDSKGSVGYVVTDGTEENTVAYATDIGHISDSIVENLLGVKNVIIESNHDKNMLLCGAYPYDIKRRILSDYGHLSNEACAEFVRELVGSGTKRILLAHLSPENNLPELALEASRLAIIDKEDIYLEVASMNTPTKLV